MTEDLTLRKDLKCFPSGVSVSRMSIDVNLAFGHFIVSRDF